MTRKLRLTLLAAAGFAGLAVFAGQPVEAGEGTDLYFGFTRIDPDAETVTPDSWIVVEDGHIEAMGTGTPPRGAYATRHDLTGQYGLPGFIDAHAHITAGPHAIEVVDGAPLVTMESVDAVTQYNARIALGFGITTARNPGADPEANARYDAQIAAGNWVGPEALHAGAVIQPAPFGGNAFVHPQSPEEWDAEASRQASLGMRYFKLYHGLSEDELALGIEAAHAHGLQAIAHLDQVSWATAADLGIDALLHALPTSADLLEPGVREAYLAGRGPDSKFMYQWFEYADFDGPVLQALFAQLAEQKIAVDLTLVVNVLNASPDPMSFFPEEERQLYHPDSFASAARFMVLSAQGWTEDDFERAGAALPRALEFAQRLHAAGVPMMIGTDSAGGTPFYARELDLHARAGIPAWDVLRMATSDAAGILGLDGQTGRIAPGYEADLVFLSANPLDDLNQAREVELVVTDGRAFSAPALRAGAVANSPEQ